MRNRKKAISWFAALPKTKLLCNSCKELKLVKKYLGEGQVMLECKHVRHARGTDVTEVEATLDGKPLK